MRASVLLPDRTLAIEERPVPIPEDDEVLVRVSSVGVCGSDVHYYKEGRIGDFVVDAPLVLGHEASGTICAVGSRVPSSRIGERVSIEPQRPSPLSQSTLAGRYNLDPNMRFFATPPVDGAFQEYVTIQDAFAHRVPDTISDDAAALLEPLSVAVAAVRKAALGPGSRVLIAGAGPIGLAMALTARAYGAVEIIVAEVDERRRHAAHDFGATATIDPTAEEPATPLQVDAFIDASGATPAIRSGILALRPAGVAVLVGMGAREIALPLAVIQNRELVITGTFRYANTWQTAISLASAGGIELDRLVSAHYSLDQVQEALEAAARPGTIKSVVQPNSV
jgi:L-iditol 2-dehydrogenase